MAFALTSPHFTANGAIPSRFTCEAEDVSPALDWTDPPAGTRSFALIVDDPERTGSGAATAHVGALGALQPAGFGALARSGR